MSKKLWNLTSILVLVAIILMGCSTPEPPKEPEPTTPPPMKEVLPTESAKLILATTTSTQDSGLLDYILPNFQDTFNMQVEVIAVGTGQAIALGEDGNADVLLVHARSREDAFMDAGHGVRRQDVMYNDFVILGPSSDPAGIQGMKQAPKALARIAESESPFVSRGDDSGTHTKEKAIWTAAEIEPAGDWYISAGQGMGAVITMADEQQAYTLSDRATYLARTLEGTALVILVSGDPIMFNPYGVIAVNPEKNEQINNDLANQFIDWLISLPTQEMVAEFGVDKFGAPLFTPDSSIWREAHSSSEQAAGDAALRITGNVETEVGWAEDEVRAMDTIEAESTNKTGETSFYTGVLISVLLSEAGPKDEATMLTFVADDGYTAEIPLPDIEACTDCIVSFRNQGGFSIVAPGFPGTSQVKDVIEIQVK